MNPATYKVLERLLNGKWFGLAVDLGAGEGSYGPLFKKHAGYLIGVDRHLARLSVAKKFSCYDQVIWADIREYTPPSETEAVFMIDVIEHLSKPDGVKLLKRLSWAPFIVVTTPSRYHPYGLRNHHVSVWTREEFEKLNFKTSTFWTPLSFLEGDKILAVRDNS